MSSNHLHDAVFEAPPTTVPLYCLFRVSLGATTLWVLRFAQTLISLRDHALSLDFQESARNRLAALTYWRVFRYIAVASFFQLGLCGQIIHEGR